MKKIIKISSLGLVALLASCGKNAATPLKKVSPLAAIDAASSIMRHRDAQYYSLGLKDKEDRKNPLYNNGLLPFDCRKLSADIVIKNDDTSSKTYMGASQTESESITIKKHLFFDLDHLYCHAHISFDITSTAESEIPCNYSDADFYAFFIEDEKQPEELEGLDKIGSYYVLENVGGILKLMIGLGTGGSEADFLDDIVAPMFINHYNDDTIINTDGTFSLNAAASTKLVSTPINLSLTDEYIYVFSSRNEYFPTDYDDGGDSVLFMNDWLINFGGDPYSYEGDVAYSCINLSEYLKEYAATLPEDDAAKTYFNYAFRSNDAKSLGLDTDLSISSSSEEEDDDYVLSSGSITTQSSSFVIKDSYLTESHLSTNNQEYEISTPKGAITYLNAYSSSTTTTIDQTINYSPNDKVEIPSDYLDYIFI